MAYGVSTPRGIRPTLRGSTPYGPGASRSGYAPVTGGRVYNDIPLAPDEIGAGSGGSGGIRPAGTVETGRTTRPSLFGNFGQTLGDIATGAANVSSTDPIIAFAQGFSGERGARAQRENIAYDRQVAEQDKTYQRELDQKRLDMEQRRIDAYQEAAGLKQKPMVDDRGQLTAEGEKFLIQEDIAYEKSLISSMGLQTDISKPEAQAAIHAMVRQHHQDNETQLRFHGNIGQTDAGPGTAAEAAAAPDAGVGLGDMLSGWADQLAPEAKKLPSVGGIIQGAGNALLNGIDAGVNAITAGMPGTGGVPPPVPSPAAAIPSGSPPPAPTPVVPPAPIVAPGGAPPPAVATPAALAPRAAVDLTKIPPAAIAALKANPMKRADFDQMFGAGSAAAILGQ